MLQPGNDLHLRAGDFTSNGMRHCWRAAAIILAGDNQCRMPDRWLRSDQFTHAMRQNSTTGGIALRVICQNPSADIGNDIRFLTDEIWREPACHCLINVGAGATNLGVGDTFFNKRLRIWRSLMG